MGAHSAPPRPFATPRPPGRARNPSEGFLGEFIPPLAGLGMTAVRLRPNPSWEAAGRTAVAPRVVSEAEHSAAVMPRPARGARHPSRGFVAGAIPPLAGHGGTAVQLRASRRCAARG